MKMCNKFTALLLALVAWLPMCAATGDASALLADLRKHMSAPSVEALFTIDGADGPVQGSATMAGAKIAMTTPQMCVWYDGTTQWTYVTSSRELNISEPDAAELLATNPFAILTADATRYSSKRLADLAGNARIELVPADTSAGIASIVIAIDKRSKWPADIALTFTDGRKINLKVDKISAGQAEPISAFRYNKAAYPASEIIDLR